MQALIANPEGLEKYFEVRPTDLFTSFIQLVVTPTSKLQNEFITDLHEHHSYLAQNPDSNEINKFSGLLKRIPESEDKQDLILKTVTLLLKTVVHEINFSKNFTASEKGKYNEILDGLVEFIPKENPLSVMLARGKALVQTTQFGKVSDEDFKRVFAFLKKMVWILIVLRIKKSLTL